MKQKLLSTQTSSVTGHSLVAADTKAVVNERFTYRARFDKGHDKVIALGYRGHSQDYLVRAQELIMINSCMGLTG